MNAPLTPDSESEQQKSSMLLDVLIRAGLIFVLAALCYQIFAPFLTLMVWALILAVAMYPLHQMLARRIGGKQGLAATLIALIGAVLIVAPTAVLMGSLADSVQQLVHGVQDNTLQIPAPRPGVAEWPVVGKKVHAFWSKAHADLPALVQSLQPKIGNLAKAALGFVAGVGGGILMFLASFLIAGVIMAFGAEGARSSEAIFARIMSPERAPEFVKLSTATIRAVAQGVIGVALIQAIAVGVTLLVAQVPLAGVLAVIVLVLGIAQIPAVLVTLPAIAYIWTSGDYGNGAAIVYSVVLFLAGIADNFLKPLMLGRGVDAPMPVILLGALGGMAAAGILGLFVGAVLLALGYQIFMGWVHHGQAAGRVAAGRLIDVGDVPMTARPAARRTAVLAALLASGCSPVGPDFQRPDVPWLEGWQVPIARVRRRASRSRPRPRRSTSGGRSSTIRPSTRWWPKRSARTRASPWPARGIMEARAQLGIAGSGLYPQLQQLSGQALWVGQDTSDGPSSSFGSLRRSHSTSPGRWTSGASTGAASRRPMRTTSPASRSTTTCRCWSRRRPPASTPRSARSSSGCASRTRTRPCRSAASRSPSGCSRAATSPSSTCSRRSRCTSARSRPFPNWRAPCARRRTR